MPCYLSCRNTLKRFTRARCLSDRRTADFQTSLHFHTLLSERRCSHAQRMKLNADWEQYSDFTSLGFSRKEIVGLYQKG